MRRFHRPKLARHSDLLQTYERMKIIGQHAGYGPAEYYHQVVDALVKFWGIARLQPALAGAIEARHRILVHRDRLARVAQRLDRARETQPPQANAGRS